VIDRQQIVDLATTTSLTPHVVEKDYVLGWLLWGIHNTPSVSGAWVFKGGTCLKKCFFETYRFSEDLDFTVQNREHMNSEFLSRALDSICEAVYEQTGIEFPADLRRIELYENPRGIVSCQAKVAYRGPVSPPGKNAPRIKLDLSVDEILVLPPIQSSVYHPYTDEPEGGIHTISYSYVEAFAEKVRALAERTRPRDLYDVINLFRRHESRPEAAELLSVLRQKCKFKEIGLPGMAAIIPHWNDLVGSWGAMLEHQLPALPPLQTFWDALPEFFAWLVGERQFAPLTAYAGDPTEELITQRTQYIAGVSRPARSSLDIIRFSAANRLLVELRYQGSTRVIEPYSLRRTSEGNVVLHAHNVERNEHRSYRVDRIEGARATERVFAPRHQIELTATGSVSIQQNVATSPTIHVRSRPTPRTVRPMSTFSQGPTYIYECSVCGKTFRRTSQTSRLNRHKDKMGYPCFGTMALLKHTEY
jgi:predicted nucleotidyltransferase component of viral defense system